MLEILDTVNSYCDEIPPIDNSQSRYGNPAFRDFYDRIAKVRSFSYQRQRHYAIGGILYNIPTRTLRPYMYSDLWYIEPSNFTSILECRRITRKYLFTASFHTRGVSVFHWELGQQEKNRLWHRTWSKFCCLAVSRLTKISLCVAERVKTVEMRNAA